MMAIDGDRLAAAAASLSLATRVVDLSDIRPLGSDVPSPVCIIATEPERAAHLLEGIELALRKHLHEEANRWRNALQCLPAGSSAMREQTVAQGTGVQPWLIVDLLEGGLDRLARASEAQGGALVTCLAVHHHGVLRLRDALSNFCVLATGRAPGRQWDLPNDFGHEGAHAWLGKVPLFSQRLQQVGSIGFSRAMDTGISDRDKVGMWCYIASEVLVWFVRDEMDPTETGLRSLRSHSDLVAFLRVGEELGYETAELQDADLSGTLHQHQVRTRQLAAICLSAQRVTSLVLDREEPPSAVEWRQLANH